MKNKKEEDEKKKEWNHEIHGKHRRTRKNGGKRAGEIQ